VYIGRVTERDVMDRDQEAQFAIWTAHLGLSAEDVAFIEGLINEVASDKFDEGYDQGRVDEADSNRDY
jgi:hypothetical protein